MNSLMNFIADGGQQADSAVLFGAIFFTFMFMFFFVLGITDIVQRRNDIRKRAALDLGFAYSGAASATGSEETGKSLRFQSFVETSAMLAKVERGQKDQQEMKAKEPDLNANWSAPAFSAHAASFGSME